MSKFKVGQKWLSRNGISRTISSISEDSFYSILAYEEDYLPHSFTENGFFISDKNESKEDLVILVEDVSAPLDEVEQRLKAIALKYAPDYPNVENCSTTELLYAIEATLEGFQLANSDLHKIIKDENEKF